MKRRRFLSNTLGLVSLPALKGSDFLSLPSPDHAQAGEGPPGIKNIICRGDIERDSGPVANETWIPLYQGNGRFGSCFGPWGLHAAPDADELYQVPGEMRFTHLQHFIRGKYNADYLLPVGNMYWENGPDGVSAYHQHQSFFDGTVSTTFKTSDYEIGIVSWFDPSRRDIAGFRIHASGNCPAIILAPFRKLSLSYGQEIVPAIETRMEKDLWQADIKYRGLDSKLNVRSTAGMESVGRGLKLILRPGLNEILVSLNGDISVSAAESLESTRSWWHATWQNTGWLDLPEESAQKVWVRSLAYTLYSHNDDGIGCSPPTGLAGNAWPFPFPFDSGCRHPLLLATGQTNAAKKWIEFWHSRLEGLKEYTRRFYHSDGVFMPHVFPYGPAFGYHDPDVPNKYYFPVYNSALMARMVDQTAVMVNDPAWSRTYAEPLIEGAAKFYLSHLEKGRDGLWHLHLVPSISLDESGDVNKPDYFSGLVSAQYTLRKAIEYGLDNSGRIGTILQDGLALNALVAENGIYRNHPGNSVTDFARQKHPDQLFPLVHTPLGPTPDEPTRNAHELRYQIADGASEFRFIGHTLGEFILSSTRMKDAAGWRKDWSAIFRNKYTDPDLIQFYESSGNTLSFYITTHGLFAQALLETVVSSWWGVLDLASCIPWKGTVRFGNIRTLLGVTVSGEVKDGNGRAALRAWKDTSFRYRGRNIAMKENEELTVKIQSA